jgi:calcineurin-like phosphoesterase family protein
MLKINNKNVYITSDTHFGHAQKFIYEKRGFRSVAEHDSTIIENINNLVNEDDVLFHLGDFCLNTTYERFEQIINSIKCQNIYCLWGNHNSRIREAYEKEVKSFFLKNVDDDNLNHALFKETPDIYPYRYKNIVFVGYHLECIIQGKYVVLNHFPIEVWENMKEGSYMLCGHSHYSLERTRKESTDGLTLDCGWEGHNSIYNFNEIVTIMKNKQIRTVDHHVKASVV